MLRRIGSVGSSRPTTTAGSRSSVRRASGSNDKKGPFQNDRSADGGRPAPTKGPNEEVAEGGFEMKLPRRQFLHLAAGAAGLPALSRVARAQAYPARPVTLIVFVPAGATPDIIARLIGQSLSQRLGQSVVIDNRPGAGGNLALQAVARAPAD